MQERIEAGRVERSAQTGAAPAGAVGGSTIVSAHPAATVTVQPDADVEPVAATIGSSKHTDAGSGSVSAIGTADRLSRLACGGTSSSEHLVRQV